MGVVIKFFRTCSYSLIPLPLSRLTTRVCRFYIYIQWYIYEILSGPMNYAGIMTSLVHVKSDCSLLRLHAIVL